jgi:hypothetical protein
MVIASALGTTTADAGSRAPAHRAVQPKHARAQRPHHPRRGAAHRRHRRAHRVTTAHVASAGAPLVFGIYPGGPAGTLGPAEAPRPEDPAKRLAALEALRPAGIPLVLHLYAGFGGPTSSAVQQVGAQITQYTAAGFGVELVLCYRPGDGGSPSAVTGFVKYVRDTVRGFAGNPRFVSLQVTNEANLTGAPNASDGYYAGAADALAQGVIAAHDEIRRDGASQIRVGFNWAYATGANATSFWSGLAARGGSALAAALDWVGLDVYPGTWGPPMSGGLAAGTTSETTAALGALRNHMSAIGVAGSVPIHVSENGYPTGPGRTDAMQVTAVRAAVTAVEQARVVDNVSDYRLFDLRDGYTGGGSFETQYGLMTDDYTPKPAFAEYRQLIATLGAGG